MVRHRSKTIKNANPKVAAIPPGERVTLVRSQRPSIVAKQFRFEDGKLKKKSVANISEGLAWSKAADDAESFAAILRHCSDRTDCCVIPGRFSGDDINGKPFRLVDEAALARRLKKPEGSNALAGIHVVGQDRVAARLKRTISSSAWVLLDADDAPGMPEEMRRLDIHRRLEAFEKLLPGITTAERILSRSSSFRVRRHNEPPHRHGHVWLRVSDPSKIEVLRTYLTIATVNAGLAFESPRFARKDDPERGIKKDDEIGSAWRTLFDLSVLIPGRLVFIAKPILDSSATEAGYVLDGPGIVVENAGGGALDISAIEIPTPEALVEHNRITRTRTTITRRAGGTSIGVHVRGVLTGDTPIERHGITKPLSGWLADLKPGVKLRCEAPFRERLLLKCFAAAAAAPRGAPFRFSCSTTNRHTSTGDGCPARRAPSCRLRCMRRRFVSSARVRSRCILTISASTASIALMSRGSRRSLDSNSMTSLDQRLRSLMQSRDAMAWGGSRPSSSASKRRSMTR
jgi:hypothetical protein